MTKRYLVLTLVIGIAFSCTSVVHKTVDYTELVSKDLQALSTNADKAVTAGIMTKDIRQAFAKEVMLPAIDAEQKLTSFLLSYDPSKPVPAQFDTLFQLSTDGVVKYINKLPNALEREVLLTGFDTLHTDLVNWINSLGRR